jgi:hypothetical protein
MKDDYLWDKSGEPDPEIQHLERVLGQLRGSRSVQDMMPAFENLPRTKARIFSKALAIAAVLAFAVLTLGAFVLLQNRSKNQGSVNLAMAADGSNLPGMENEAPAPLAGVTGQPANALPAPVEVSITRPKRSAPEARRRSINRTRDSYFNEREQAEGLMAKEQLIKALQITSSKLESVQKKVQGDRIQVPLS